jgi:N-acylneuraminate cytidylyltransferase
VIPARGGSKRIPRKNIKNFCGKPMLVWSIELAHASACFDRILVSTDDEEIAAVARAGGAETPFMRPAALADDHTGTVAVVAHAIRAMESQGQVFSHICCIYPTAPLLQPGSLREAYERLVAARASFAFGAVPYGHPIQRALRIDGDGRVSMFETRHAMTRSQDLEPAFHDAGQFCWGTREAFLGGASPLTSGQAVAVVLPRHRAVDIDTLEDWDLAQALHRVLSSRGL